MLTLTYFTARLNFATFLIVALFLNLICKNVIMTYSMEFIEAFNMNLVLYNQLNHNGRIMREQDQGLLRHVNQMRVQLSFMEIVVLVPIFIRNVYL